MYNYFRYYNKETDLIGKEKSRSHKKTDTTTDHNCTCVRFPTRHGVVMLSPSVTPTGSVVLDVGTPRRMETRAPVHSFGPTLPLLECCSQ